jgi:hypothetical protein
VTTVAGDAGTGGAPGKPKAPGTAGAAAKEPGRSGAQAPPSLQQILAQVKTLMRTGGMNNPSTAIKTLNLLSQIRPEDVPAALAAAEEMKEPQGKMMLYMVLLSQWAEKDGPAALKYADEKLSKQGPMVQMARMSVLSSWAQTDPDAAWAYVQKDLETGEGGGPMGGRSMMMMGLFSSLAAKDPEKAFARLGELTEKRERQMALNGIAQTAFDDSSRQRLMDEIGKLPDATERKEARGSVLGQLAMMEPEKAIELSASLPEDERHAVASQVGRMMMMSDPKKGAEFLLQNAPGPDKSNAYTEVVSQWAGQDPNAAGAWLGAQPQTPELDGARGRFAATVADRDPESAMAWAKTITSEERRADAIGEVYGTWRKKDEATANAALEASGISAEKIASFRALDPNSPRTVREGPPRPAPPR